MSNPVPIHNYVTELTHNDKDYYNIVTFTDFDRTWDEKSFAEYLNCMIANFPILKQRIVKNTNSGTCYWVEDDAQEFCLENMYDIHCKYGNWAKHTDAILNEPFSTKFKWKCTVFNNADTAKSRFYFKIDHAYCDGYKLLEMLTKPLITKKYSPPSFQNRDRLSVVDRLYYLIFGTIMLMILNLKIITRQLCAPPPAAPAPAALTHPPYEKKMEHIRLKSMNLARAKCIANKHGITVNDFVYALSIKAWYEYNSEFSGSVTSVSAINVKPWISIDPVHDTNNIQLMFVETNARADTLVFLKNVHHFFNLYKHSLFIPITNTIITHLCPSTRAINDAKTCAYDKMRENSQITFSNVIGPDICDCRPIVKMGFCTVTKFTEIGFNHMSYDGVIRSFVSAREGVIRDKKKFKKCFLKTYREFMQL